MNKLILILFLLIPGYVQADESLVGENYKEDAAILKEELRKLRKDQDAETLDNQSGSYYNDISNSSITGETSGDIQYYDGSQWNRLAKGTTGQVLQTGTPPSWITLLGDWVDKSSSYGNQQAATDGFVAGVSPFGNTLQLFTDAGNPATVKRGQAAGGQSCGVLVKKSDYWKVTVDGGSPSVYWIPLGN